MIVCRIKSLKWGLLYLTAGFIATASRGIEHPIPVEPEPVQADLFIHGDEGIPVYRIPALLTTPKGTLLAFAEARHGSGEDHEHIEVVLRRSTDAGTTWSPMEVVARDGSHAVQNPTVVADWNTGTIWLVVIRTDTVKYKTWKDLAKSREPTRRVWVLSSMDDGVTWSPPRDITDSVCKPEWRECVPGPGIGIQTSSGRLVIPSYFVDLKDSKPRAVMLYSDDGGRTWRSGEPTDPPVNECQAVELEDGSLLLNMRQDRRTGYRAVSKSRDGGITWTPIEDDEELVEPVCQASLIRFTDLRKFMKNRLLFSNPAQKEIGNRTNLTIRLSYDEGETWPVSRTLWPECSIYSCLAVLPDYSIGCLYERGSGRRFEKITFARFSLGWLTNGADLIQERE